MYEFQAAGTAFLKNVKRGILGDEPGLGKSKQSLEAAEGKTLIVAPASIVNAGVWETQLNLWAPNLDAVVVPYTQLTERIKVAATIDKRASSIASDTLKPELETANFDTIIFDEAHYLKEKKTKWTIGARHLTNPLKSSKRKAPDNVFLLSGTPTPNWAHEIYVPLTICRPNDMVPGGDLKSYWRWVEQNFHTEKAQYGGSFSKNILGVVGCHKSLWECSAGPPVICAHWADFIRRNFTYQGKEILLRRLRDAVLSELPPMTEVDLEIPMLPEQKKVYDQLHRDCIVWLQEQETNKHFSVEVWNAPGLFAKLMKCATGVDVMAYPETVAKESTLSNKLNLWESYIEAQTHPSLTVGAFKATVELAAKRARAQGKTVETYTGSTPKTRLKGIIADFQAGNIECLVATIEKVKEGLTLTAADNCHMLERSFRPASNEQVVRRMHRIGQTRPVTLYNYYSKGTHEKKQAETLRNKLDQQVKALTPRELLDIIT